MSKPKRTRDASGLSYGEGSIVPRSGRFQARWLEHRLDGSTSLRGLTFDTHDQAQDHLRRVHRTKRDGRFVPPEQRTVNDLIDEWLKHGQARWKPWTYRTYKDRVELHVRRSIGELKAENLTAARVQYWLDGFTARGYKPSMIESLHRILSSALNEAVSMKALPENVARFVRRPPVRQPEIATWSPEHVATVLHALAADPTWRALYLLAVTTGMRPGELRALTWADLDLEHSVLTVRRTMTRDADNRVIMGKSTKTNMARIVALAPSTVAALVLWRTEQKKQQLMAERWQKTDLVFTRADGRFLPTTTWQRRHTDLIAETGVPGITLHGLRHTSATVSLLLGESPKIVAERLGHLNIATTLGRYSHISMELQRSAASAMEDRIFGVDGDNTPPKTAVSDLT